MAHLTCVNATRAELLTLLDEYAGAGIANLLALRGDPPKGQQRFTPTDGGCEHAADLIDLIRDHGGFSTLCAAFPERHPESSSREADWAHLADKLRRGACGAITQCFFEPTAYADLMRHLTALCGRTPRIIPGILPITDFHAVERFCERCGAAIPDDLRSELAPLADDKVAVRKAGMAWTVRFCQRLLRAGAPGLHIYALNRSTATAELVTTLRQYGNID